MAPDILQHASLIRPVIVMTAMITRKAPIAMAAGKQIAHSIATIATCSLRTH